MQTFAYWCHWGPVATGVGGSTESWVAVVRSSGVTISRRAAGSALTPLSTTPLYSAGGAFWRTLLLVLFFSCTCTWLSKWYCNISGTFSDGSIFCTHSLHREILLYCLSQVFVLESLCTQDDLLYTWKSWRENVPLHVVMKMHSFCRLCMTVLL